MLYLLFFLLRDGSMSRESDAMPLRGGAAARARGSSRRIRATMKGNVVVAIVQGALGGLMFWILGIDAPALGGADGSAVAAAAVGTAMVWRPVAVYLLATGGSGRASC